VSAPVEETLAYEAEQRPRVAAVALAGAVLTVAGNVMLTMLASGGPTESDGFISLPEALDARVAGREPEGPSLWVQRIDHWGDNAALLSVSSVLTSLAAVCLILTILFLYRATAARTEGVGRVPYYAALAALVLYPVPHLVREVAQWIGSANFQDAAVRNTQTAQDVLGASVVGIGSALELLGTFALAVAVVLISLNAMRIGVLTRFWGVLGILTGVLTVFQADQPGIVRAVWLIGVGLLIAGRIKAPPAWETGRAEPWPTQQQLREQREAAAGRAPKPAPQAGAEPNGDGPLSPAQARKKRKRRR
jgi:hypothetical protein